MVARFPSTPSLLTGLCLLLALPFAGRAASIFSFSPDHGGPGTEVVINGSGLQTTLLVYFGGTDATGEILEVSASHVRARVPPNALTGPISVYTSGSSYVTSPVNWIFAAAPRIESFTPLSGPPDTPVTISGANFGTTRTDGVGNVTNVLFNGQRALFIVTSVSQLLAIVPTNATSGPITVANAADSFSTTLPFQVPALLTGFSPTNGQPGDVVEIRGSNLGATVSVKFGLETAPFTVLSSSALRAEVPTNAINAVIQVSTPTGPTSTATQFVVRPRIIDFAPITGAPGTNVTLSGGGFHGLKEVRFGSLLASIVPPATNTQVTVVVPANATTGPITLTTTNGTFTTTNLFHLPARLTSFSPNSGARDTVVTLDGVNLAGTTNVLFNGVPAEFTVVSATRVTTKVPALATTGRIAVRTPAGEALSSGTFNVRPVLDGFTPGHGPVGTPVTLLGAGLTNIAWVRIGDSEAQFTLVDPTRIRLIVPLNAYSGPIHLRTQAGLEVSAPGTFFVDGAQPVVTSFTPTNGPVGSKVALTGEGLRTASRVQFHGTDAPFTVQSATQIEATVPVGATSGTLAVTTLDGIAITATPFLVVIPPVTLSIQPTADSIILRWSSNAVGYALESTGVLGSAAVWTPVLESPVNEGATFRVTLPLPDTGNRYFRLRK
jgi:hypothetical protein